MLYLQKLVLSILLDSLKKIFIKVHKIGKLLQPQPALYFLYTFWKIFRIAYNNIIIVIIMTSSLIILTPQSVSLLVTVVDYDRVGGNEPIGKQ